VKCWTVVLVADRCESTALISRVRGPKLITKLVTFNGVNRASPSVGRAL
jgi:hypothetical protein